ncbi:MAG: hypothetical protein FD180_1758 [Planctomycetota bacterium]|nr:MAG: hypothetical protein FD180_1758 [Planctomycetota bacterium]
MQSAVHPTQDRLVEVFNIIERHIEDRYGIPVMISDVLDPNTGDFDGVQIKIDYANDIEIAVFVLIHLFGHTVQWNTHPRFREIGQDTNLRKSEEELKEIAVYEKEATQLSMALLHEAGVRDLDQWVSDWWRADFAWLTNFYRTGERADFRKYMRAGAEPPLGPVPIPAFKPVKWVSRWSF